jgi:hypothetical protein
MNLLLVGFCLHLSEIIKLTKGFNIQIFKYLNNFFIDRQQHSQPGEVQRGIAPKPTLLWDRMKFLHFITKV